MALCTRREVRIEKCLQMLMAGEGVEIREYCEAARHDSPEEDPGSGQADENQRNRWGV
jgi:hypothetical protein